MLSTWAYRGRLLQVFGKGRTRVGELVEALLGITLASVVAHTLTTPVRSTATFVIVATPLPSCVG